MMSTAFLIANNIVSDKKELLSKIDDLILKRKDELIKKYSSVNKSECKSNFFPEWNIFTENNGINKKSTEMKTIYR